MPKTSSYCYTDVWGSLSGESPETRDLQTSSHTWPCRKHSSRVPAQEVDDLQLNELVNKQTNSENDRLTTRNTRRTVNVIIHYVILHSVQKFCHNNSEDLLLRTGLTWTNLTRSNSGKTGRLNKKNESDGVYKTALS